MTVRTVRYLLAPFLTLASLASAAASAQETQNAFTDARHYTVRLNVSSPYSFIEQAEGSWQGAGFLVDRQRGWILTNAHVAGYAPTRIRAEFNGHAAIDAKAVFIDNLLDLALLEVTAASLPADAKEARLGCDSLPAVGTHLGTYGHPMGYGFTATRGILAGTSQAHGYPMIQTDAPISPGNSGGPLINLDTGEVIGINTSSAADNRAQNMNFAVLMSHACRVLELLRAKQPATIPRLTTRFAHDADDTVTLTVARDPEQPDGFGLRMGDRVLGIVGESGAATSAPEFMLGLRGRTGLLPLRVKRGDREIVVNAQLTPSLQHVGRRGLAIGGVVFGPRHLFNVASPDDAGTLIIHHVEYGSTGALQNIDFGGEVRSVDGVSIQSLSQLERLARAADREDRPLQLLLRIFNEDAEEPEMFLVRELPADQVRWYPD